jgi:hypothetical protein
VGATGRFACLNRQKAETALRCSQATDGGPPTQAASPLGPSGLPMRPEGTQMRPVTGSEKRKWRYPSLWLNGAFESSPQVSVGLHDGAQAMGLAHLAQPRWLPGTPCTATEGRTNEANPAEPRGHIAALEPQGTGRSRLVSGDSPRDSPMCWLSSPRVCWVGTGGSSGTFRCANGLIAFTYPRAKDASGRLHDVTGRKPPARNRPETLSPAWFRTPAESRS